MLERFYNHALQLFAPLLRLPATMYLNGKRWDRQVGLICDLEDYWLRSTVLVAMTYASNFRCASVKIVTCGSLFSAPGVAEPSALPSTVVYVGTIMDEHSFHVHVCRQLAGLACILLFTHQGSRIDRIATGC